MRWSLRSLFALMAGLAIGYAGYRAGITDTRAYKQGHRDGYYRSKMEFLELCREWQRDGRLKASGSRGL